MNKVISREYVEKNYVHKDKIKEILSKHKKFKKLAAEQIEGNIIIADSDSLNFGRKETHQVIINDLEELLGEENE